MLDRAGTSGARVTSHTRSTATSFQSLGVVSRASARTTRDDAGVAAQDHFKVALRTIIGPALRAQGFKGSGTTWRLTATNGDVAVVNVQRSQSSTATHLRCVVNLSIVPLPWWDWQRAWMPAVRFTAPNESHGLWRDRLHPTGASANVEVWWQMTDDERSATRAALDIVRQLEWKGLPTLRRLLDRAALLASIRDGDFGFVKGQAQRASVTLAILLADEGPSVELEDLLTHLANDPGGGRDEATRAMTDWARARAESRR